MRAPFFEFGLLSDGASLVVALLIGIAFGWFLERSGMGNARKLAGQFYLRDMTVFKVMFTAIVTAMLGVFWLGWLGVLDVSRVYVPETWIVPQLVGGIVFGFGFVIAGLCPGTSCVAAASGRIDGMVVVIGMFAGVLGIGLLLGRLQSFYESTPRGSLTFPDLLNVSTGLIVFFVTVVAIVGFIIADRIEQRSSRASAS
ncbi:MAG TPA: YeeE/YedE thiosulfate transporter family protein [Gemmatimonadaceae bacterium]|nr:YeeE/YedE thiosulfate transporter family protein [Gemmatimonadaceae bacterium]